MPLRTSNECGTPPGDPASWPLDQKGKACSAKDCFCRSHSPVSQETGNHSRHIVWTAKSLDTSVEVASTVICVSCLVERKKVQIFTHLYTALLRRLADAWSGDSRSFMAQPSTFATLLRRSKFASYDPAILQVYTAPPAHAHRGDFGFKRPMPRLARKRASHVIITNADTREYQTEWANAESQSKFVRRMDETGAKWETMNGSWHMKTIHADWITDSEFDNSPRDYESSLFRPPSFNSMPPQEFNHYVERTRELQPAFRQYLEQQRIRRNAEKEEQHARSQATHKANYEKKYGTTPASYTERPKHYELETQPVNLYASAQIPPLASGNDRSSKARERAWALTAHRNFLAEHTKKNLLQSSTTTIAPLPHKHAGLSYHHPSALQSVLTSPPIPGHVLPTANHTAGYMASPPPRSRLAHRRAANGFVLWTQQGYTAHLGGSYAAEFPRHQVFDETTGQTATDDRVPPFLFFSPNTVKPAPDPPTSNTRAPGHNTFRLDRAELLSAPIVVRDRGEAVEGAQKDRLEKGAVGNAFSLNRSLSLSAKPWAAVEHRRNNPHPLGTPAYVAHRETPFGTSVTGKAVTKNHKGKGPRNIFQNNPLRRVGAEAADKGRGETLDKLSDTLLRLLRNSTEQGPKKR